MRKQYHFRPGEAGLRAWDVGRLVRLSSQLKPELVAVAGIRELDEPDWGQPMTCRGVAEHARLIDESDFGFPIILSSDGRIIDGMHRVLKALLQGRREIAAVRFEIDPEPDYVGVLDPDDLPYEDEPTENDGNRDATSSGVGGSEPAAEAKP